MAAAAWLREQRKSHSLTELRQSLSSQGPALDEALTNAIRSELPSLLGISASVGHAEERLRELVTTLRAHSDSATDFAGRLKTRLNEVSTLIDERAALQTQSDDVRLLRRLAEALANMERLLRPAAAADGAAADVSDDAGGGEVVASSDDGRASGEALEALEASAARLLRASGECGRLLLLRRRAAELLPVQRHAARLSEARAELLRQLCGCLRRALAAASDESADEDGGGNGGNEEERAARYDGVVATVLRGFADAEGEDEAVSWLRTAWVEPRLKPLLVAAADASDASMASVAAVLEGFVAGRAFAPIARADCAAHTPLHLLAGAPWTVFCRTLGEGGHTHLFGAGMPDVFHTAYHAVNDVVARLEDGHLRSTALIRHLRAHPETAGLRRRFNLPIYFQLRLQEATKPLEAALAASEGAVQQIAAAAADADADAAPEGGSLATLALAPPQGLTTAACSEFCKASLRCVNARVFLLPLASRLFRLLLQCLSRFTQWLQALLDAAAAASDGGGGRGGAALARGAPPPTAADATVSNDASSGAAAAAAAPSAAATAATPARALLEADGAAALYLDLLAVVAWLRDEVRPRLPSLLHLPASSEALIAECTAALAEGTDALAGRVAAVRTLLVGGQSSACAARLAPVKTIAASYRMTGKALPTQPSYFVAEVLKPLKAFVDANLARLPPEDRVEWTKEVANHVTARYLELASSTLDMVRKDEEARERLQLNKADGAAGGGVSDSQKICVQLCLDVQAFSDELKRVGVDTSGLRDYNSLQEAVRPEDGLLESLE